MTGSDLVINLQDTSEAGKIAVSVGHKQLFGAYLDATRGLQYRSDSREWFDLRLISRFGREQADLLKLQDRRTYQDLLFAGVKLEFAGEPYLLPQGTETGLRGDVALSRLAGAVWPMKGWVGYEALQRELESRGFKVNVLPTRPTLLEHLGDARGHRCLVSGDSLPMHLALGSGVKCMTIFNCTSPWEIHDYGLQIQLISPLLEKEVHVVGRWDVQSTAPWTRIYIVP